MKTFNQKTIISEYTEAAKKICASMIGFTIGNLLFNVLEHQPLDFKKALTVGVLMGIITAPLFLPTKKGKQNSAPSP